MNSKRINKNIMIIIDIIVFLLCLSIDRISKYYVLKSLKNHPSVSVIQGVLELKYLENTGASFGLLKNQTSFFILFGFVILISLIYIIVKMPGKRKYIIANILSVLLIAGTSGNVIDRILYNHVIDFIYFSSLKFPIFNFADVLISVSTGLFILLLIFYYKEDDLNFMKFLEKKIRDVE